MKTEKEIIHAAHRYMVDAINERGEGLLWADIDFANGATWAFERMKSENEHLRADIEFTKTASDGKSRVISMLMAENERFRTAIAAALAVDVTEDWDALYQIREILEKA
jgi:hypothetical protein